MNANYNGEYLSIEDIYEKLKDKLVVYKSDYRIRGIICGHGRENLIIALERKDGGFQENASKPSTAIIYSMHNNEFGYKWVAPYNIRLINVIPRNFAEQYVRDKFKELSDEQYDIYINIFEAGFEEANKINNNG